MKPISNSKMPALTCLSALWLMALASAESPYIAQLTQLNKQRDSAVSTALQPIDRKYQESLKQMLLLATKSSDTEAISTIAEAIKAGSVPSDRPTIASDALLKMKAGKWVTHYATHSDTSVLTMEADGTFTISFDNKTPGTSKARFKDGVAVIEMQHNNVTERWTLLPGRVLVEHYYPLTNYRAGALPSLVGFATLVE